MSDPTKPEAEQAFASFFDTDIKTHERFALDRKKPSRAVVALSSGCPGRGLILHAVGYDIAYEMEAGRRPSDIGLDGAPGGVWIWEGGYVDDGPGDWPGTREYRLEGTFREPTKEEWDNIENDEIPWDPADWR